MEELIQEIFDTISLEEENETIPSTDAPDTDPETTTSDFETTYQTTHDAESRDRVLESINKILQKHLNKMLNNTEEPDEHSETTQPLPLTETTPFVPDTTKKPQIVPDTTKKPQIDPIHDLFPVITRPMNLFRVTTPEPYEILDDGDNEIKTTVIGDGMGSTEEVRTETSIDVSYSVHSATTEIAVTSNDTAPRKFWNLQVL